MIGRVEIDSDGEFIIYSPTTGKVSECAELNEAKRGLRDKIAELNSWNVVSDLAVFGWADGKWRPVVTPYEIEEWEIHGNPSRVVRYQ
jgi:hypothetical protein